jgi:chromosome segregation ATPase
MNIHIHVHDHRGHDLEKIVTQIALLTNKINQIMATQVEAAAALAAITAKLDTVSTEVDKVSTETTALLVEIQTLIDAAANQDVTPELQAAIDAVASRADSLATKVAAVDALVPDAPTP